MRRVADIVSKPRIWNHNAEAISFEAQPPDQIMGTGKDHNPGCFWPIQPWRYRYVSTFNFIEIRYMEGRGY